MPKKQKGTSTEKTATSGLGGPGSLPVVVRLRPGYEAIARLVPKDETDITSRMGEPCLKSLGTATLKLANPIIDTLRAKGKDTASTGTFLKPACLARELRKEHSDKDITAASILKGSEDESSK